MTISEQLDIEELIEGFRQHMGTQAQDIAVLKATIKKLTGKIKELESSSDKVE